MSLVVAAAVARYEQHLADGGTPFSSLRRSLGALLKESLSLAPVPRSENPGDDKRFVNYGFTKDGEALLSEWMRENLNLAAVVSDDPDEVEPLLIRHRKPLLCLTGWANPYSPRIKALRKACADEARARQA
jgi:hypothetical protein